MGEQSNESLSKRKQETRRRGEECAGYVAEVMMHLRLDWPFLVGFVRNHQSYDNVKPSRWAFPKRDYFSIIIEDDLDMIKYHLNSDWETYLGTIKVPYLKIEQFDGHIWKNIELVGEHLTGARCWLKTSKIKTDREKEIARPEYLQNMFDPDWDINDEIYMATGHSPVPRWNEILYLLLNECLITRKRIVLSLISYWWHHRNRGESPSVQLSSKPSETMVSEAETAAPREKEYDRWGDISKALRVSERTAQRWAKSNKLHVEKRDGHPICRQSDIDNCLNRRDPKS